MKRLLRIGSSVATTVVALATGALGCSSRHDDPRSAGPTTSATAVVASSAQPASDRDAAFHACSARYQAVLARPAAPGAEHFDAHRAEFLGRVRGEPVVFVRAPRESALPEGDRLAAAAKIAFDRRPPGLRVVELEQRLKHDRPGLRALILREGYVYADDPDDLFQMIERVTLAELFDAETIWLERKGERHRLERRTIAKEPVYVFTDGRLSGRPAGLLFGDRVGATEAELDAPLTRDVRGLADHEGFERMRVDRLTETDLAVTLRFGDVETKAVVESHGAELALACVAEPVSVRERAAKHAKEGEAHRAAMRALSDTVTEVTFEAHPFDRPRGVTGPDRDGELRPFWVSAYLRGQQSFEHDGETYTVYRADGRPNTPEVCVDFVLDCFERTAGSWYAPRGERPHRDPGRLTFDGLKVDRPRGVIALGKLAEAEPTLFEMRRFEGAERIPFGERAKFFRFLEEHADELAPGDILSIQGLKRDDRVHQHAILLEAIDPLTGFPYGLADQMRLPRRRSWEGIMAEAPKRSLYYRIRPRETVWGTFAREGETALADTAK